jgi:hypothetical protein
MLLMCIIQFQERLGRRWNKTQRNLGEPRSLESSVVIIRQCCIVPVIPVGLDRHLPLVTLMDKYCATFIVIPRHGMLQMQRNQSGFLSSFVGVSNMHIVAREYWRHLNFKHHASTQKCIDLCSNHFQLCVVSSAGNQSSHLVHTMNIKKRQQITTSNVVFVLSSTTFHVRCFML